MTSGPTPSIFVTPGGPDGVGWSTAAAPRRPGSIPADDVTNSLPSDPPRGAVIEAGRRSPDAAVHCRLRDGIGRLHRLDRPIADA